MVVRVQVRVAAGVELTAEATANLRLPTRAETAEIILEVLEVDRGEPLLPMELTAAAGVVELLNLERLHRELTEEQVQNGMLPTDRVVVVGVEV
jgi:hypothetical protein